VWQSSNIVIASGLIDGNTSQYGGAVQIDDASKNVVVTDVDAVHTQAFCFSSWVAPDDGGNIEFRNLRCRDTACNSQKQPELAYVGPPPQSGKQHYGVRFENDIYANLCSPNTPTWGTAQMEIADIRQEDFIAKTAPLRQECDQ
jgi:hypothetical protein